MMAFTFYCFNIVRGNGGLKIGILSHYNYTIYFLISQVPTFLACVLKKVFFNIITNFFKKVKCCARFTFVFAPLAIWGKCRCASPCPLVRKIFAYAAAGKHRTFTFVTKSGAYDFCRLCARIWSPSRRSGSLRWQSGVKRLQNGYRLLIF